MPLPIAALVRRSQSDDAEFILQIQRNRMNAAISALRRPVPSKQLHEAAAYAEEISGIAFTPEEMTTLLDLFPIERGVIATDGVHAGTDTQETVSRILAAFFLGSTWPTYGDKVDINDFLRLLQTQAAQMGYRVAKPA